MRRTAPFTSLMISNYGEGPQATSLLIQWPAVLSHFHFSGYAARTHVMDYSTLESLLLIHQNTLKYINIQGLRLRENSRLLNATLFPKLGFLELSIWDTHGSTVQFRASDTNILGLKLETFCWNCSVGGYERWTSFNEANCVWIRDLANAAVACNAALRRIEIKFCPDYTEQEEEMIYPWDLMDDLRDKVLQPKGIDLSYNDPPVSKEKWIEHLNAPKREELLVEGVDCSVVSQEDQSTESSEQMGCKGGYEGEDLRKYFISTSKSQESKS